MCPGQCHAQTSCDTNAFLAQQDVEVMDWPVRSPEMNPIDRVWDNMGLLPDT